MTIKKISKMVPNSLKLKLRPIYNRLYRRATKNKTVDEIHEYWKNPDDGYNDPKNYLRAELKRSQYLTELIKKYAPKDAVILEIGCNVGRNLNHLYKNGFKHLTAIEINKTAVKLLKKSYPQMANNLKLHNVPVEDSIKKFDDNQFDVVFTMAVLQHIPPESEWIFSEMARIAKQYIITIEDETEISGRHFPRNYDRIFRQLKMKRIGHKRDLTYIGLNHNFVMNVFKKNM